MEQAIVLRRSVTNLQTRMNAIRDAQFSVLVSENSSSQYCRGVFGLRSVYGNFEFNNKPLLKDPFPAIVCVEELSQVNIVASSMIFL